MTDEEVRALWGSLNGDRSMLARVKDEGFYRPFENNRDEFNDVLNYAPTAGQQTYSNGTDDAGNEILGNTVNDFMAQPQPKEEDNSFFAGTSWGGDINAAEASERILADEEGGETNLPELIDGGRVDLGQELSALYEKMRDTSLYAQYMYSADDWAEKGKEIFDETGMDVNSLGDKNIFEKAWNLTREIKRQKALATDASGHVNMDKVYEAMPYLRDIHEAHGTAAAVMVMNSARELQTINDVYDSEAARFAASIGYGIYRGGLSVVNQYTGAKAMLRGMVSNEGLTQEEMNDILWVADEMKKLPQNSYSSFGSILGGVLGSAAENAPIMLPEMIRTAAVNLGKLTGPAGMAASAGVYALMSAQIGGAQYIENITKTDENGNPIYTPRQAALLSAFQGFAEAALEKRSIAAAGKAVFSAGTAKKLSELAAKDAALASGQTMGGVTREAAREILRERIQHGFRAGILSGAAELEEEFEQQISDMVLENMAQIAFRGDKADVSSVDEILSDAFGAAVEALPAVAGFGFMGAGGSVVADTERVLSMRERFANAKASEIARGIYENQHQQNIVYNVAENLDNVQELQGKAPEIVTEILDAQNKKAGAEDTDVNIGMLMQQDGGADIVNQIAAENGTSQEDVQACINGTGFLTVKTSALQQAIHKMTPEQQQAVFPNVAAVGHQTNEQILSYARDMKAALDAVKDKTDKETAATIERFTQESFEDEETRKAAAEIIASDTDNPYEAAKRRVRANQAAIDEYLKGTIDALKAEGGQGTSVVETMDENGDVTTGRASNNPLWYQNFYADTGRAPTNADYERIAYENLTGTATRYSTGELGNLTPEDVEYFEGVKNELDALLSEKERLRTIADALKGFGKGDFLPTASMPAETRKAYNSIYQILSASDNKKVRDNARVNAILAARMLSRLGFMWKDDAGRDVNLMEILPKLAANAVYQAQDKSAMMQEMTRQIDEVRSKYEGTDKWMKAPNGEPTNLTEEQWLTVRTDAFKNWFGDWENDPENASKVVDENGEPKQVFHGTKRSMLASKFDIFEGNGRPIWHSAAGEYAKLYYRDKKLYERGDIYSDFINIRNPINVGDAGFGGTGSVKMFADQIGVPFKELAEVFGVDKNDTKTPFPYAYAYEAINSSEFAKWAKEKGYDGIIEKEMGNETFAVFEPTQIKSATDNNGQFLVDDPNIYHQSAGANIDNLGENEQNKSAATGGAEVVVKGDEFGQYKDIKELRAKAVQYYSKNLQGTSVENKVLGKIDIDENGIVNFTGSGKREMKGTSAKTNKLLLVKYLPQLIAGATNITSSEAEKERHANETFYYLHTSATIDGDNVPVEITLVKRNDGSIQYYNHILPAEENNKNTSVSPGPESSREALGTPAVDVSFDNPNIPRGGGNVNEKSNSVTANESRSDIQGGFSNGLNPEQALDMLMQAAWHGSPHVFTKFDLGAIGTGEGAQAHGWGLYFAQDRKVSERYREELIKGPVSINGKVLDRPNIFDDSLSFAEKHALGCYLMSGRNIDEAIKRAETLVEEKPSPETKEALEILKSGGIKQINETAGSLFQVEIPDDDVLLDEQKTFDEQPEKVKAALQPILESKEFQDVATAGIAKMPPIGSLTGRTIYNVLSKQLGGSIKDGQRAASEYLNSIGIKGITYEGGRDGRCYVVFDDKSISIIDTYNQRVNGETYRGGFSAAMNLIKLFQNADESTFMHEMSHFYLNELQKIAMNAGENSQAAKDLATINGWAEWHEGDAEEYKGTASASEFAKREKQILEAQKNGFAVMEDGTKKTLAELLNEWRQEKFARGFEEYLHKGEAPTSTLKRIFRRFRDWLKEIYNDVTGAGVKATPEVEAVFARMIASDEEIEMQATIDRVADISRIDPDLMDADTEAMHERWAEEAKEEAKDKLRKELLKEQREKDVAAHMEAYEAEERERLQEIPAFQAELFVQEAGLPEEEAAQAVGYASAEAWKEDLKEWGGSYENAVKESCEAERDRYIREMPNDEHLQELAEEAIVSSEYAGRLAALEAEALRRREKKYANAPKRLAKAMEGMEAALEEETEEPLEKALRTLKYSFRWQRQQQEQIEAMQSTIDEMKARMARDKEASEEAAAQSEADKEALREKMEQQAEKGKERLRAKLKEQVNTFKAATMLNAEWLRGVRDAADGLYKMNRELAQQQLAAMPVKDSTNVRRFINDARKAAAESARAIANAVRKNNGMKKEDTGEQDYEKSKQAKLRQALFGAQAREALNLRRELQRLVNHLKRREKTLAKEKRGEIDASTKYYINHILYMMGFKKSDAIRPQTLESFGAHIASLKDAWDADNEANGNVGDLDMDFDVPDWLLNLATSGDKQPPGNYREYTMAELQDIKTIVDILYTTGRNKNRLLSMDKGIGEVVEELTEDFEKTVTVEKGDTGISSVMASLLQPVVMLKTLGPKWKQYFYDTLADAWERKTAMQQQAAQDLNALFEKHWDKKTRRKMGTKKLGITLPDGTELTKEGVISMALNCGNDGNRKRLMNGFSLTDRDVEEIFKQTMTANDWAFIQEAWNYINTYGDKVNEVVERSTGTPMKRVEPRSFVITTADGKTISLRGGYYPISYDPVKSIGKSEQELMSASQAMGGASAFSTGMSSTKARSENGLQESPLLLSADVLFRHVNQQIHIATMRLACRDVYKLLNDYSVRSMITSSLGNEAYKELKRWVENCWQEPRGANDWVSRAIGFIRGKTVTAIMAYRTSIALLNFAGPVYMARELGVWNALCALADFYSRPTEISKMRKAILEQSPFMANRANNIDRDIRKAQENSFAPGNPLTEMISEYESWAIEQTDMIFSMPTYHWTYKQTLNAELDKGTKPEDAKKKAHRAAEDVVRKIFGSADTVDQSAMQRQKNEFIKALTPFYTFVSTQANAIFEGYLKGRYQGSVRTIRDDGTIQTEKKAFLRRYWVMANAFLWTNLIGTLVEQIFRDAIGKLTGDDDDGLLDPTSEAFLRRWTAQSMTTFTSAVPIGNIMGEAIVKHITGKYYGGRNFGVADAALGRFGDAISAAFDLAEGKKDVIDAGRSVAKAIGGSYAGMPDTFTDAIFNAARAYSDNYSLNEWFIKSLFDKKLKKKGR